MSEIIKRMYSYKEENGEKLKIFLRSIPVSINNLYGDPFIHAQIEDTFYKLSRLRKAEHKGPISIITKSNLSNEIINRLTEYQKMKNLIFFYSLTGFNEGGISFKQRIDAYMRLARKMPNVVLLFRPIIANKNDSPAIIQRMVEICKKAKTALVYTAVYTKNNDKIKKDLNAGVEELIIDAATKQGVRVFPKSACATKYVLERDICYAHVNEKPQNLVSHLFNFCVYCFFPRHSLR